MSDSTESSDSQPPDRARSTGAALEAHYRFVVWLVPTLERFPRSQKFLLGDRIQHTTLDVLERLIEGTHRAVARYERFRDRHAHALRCAIYRYFPAVDHVILKTYLRRRIACERTLALADRIVDGSNRQEPVLLGRVTSVQGWSC